MNYYCTKCNTELEVDDHKKDEGWISVKPCQECVEVNKSKNELEEEVEYLEDRIKKVKDKLETIVNDLED